jgi:AraC-like DNA-binding protein
MGNLPVGRNDIEHLGSRPARRLSAFTRQTIARHRMRPRVRVALERLAGGERDLARLAAETGYSEQSYLSRVFRAETGALPERCAARGVRGAYRLLGIG